MEFVRLNQWLDLFFDALFSFIKYFFLSKAIKSAKMTQIPIDCSDSKTELHALHVEYGIRHSLTMKRNQEWSKWKMKYDSSTAAGIRSNNLLLFFMQQMQLIEIQMKNFQFDIHWKQRMQRGNSFYFKTVGLFDFLGFFSIFSLSLFLSFNQNMHQEKRTKEKFPLFSSSCSYQLSALFLFFGFWDSWNSLRCHS